ncbi:hypothetical protein [Moraxella sp. VT-16-12]|uniref:hypothetical protein n=1 Tax=Moraxella sp. VT-16-12 TaxID=2014877 RepID=UPI000B7DA702|nr:hypothetical protein [Moraxella sp. VT-16-12]TWV83378.1 hypothetical protein CEW93_003020 [Moraxella sp. VT-16-12]
MSQQSTSTNQPTTPPSLVPLGLTISLAIFALILACAGYGFRLLAGHDVGSVLRHALVVVSFFVIVVPCAFVGGAKLMNTFKHTNIQTRNALTLGLLISCVAILTIMGRYS